MTGPAPAVAALRSAVAAVLDPVPDGALVLVACSGGPDSLALAATTAFVAAGRGHRRGHRRGSAGSGGAGERGDRPDATGPTGAQLPRVRAGAVVVDHGLQQGSAQVAAEAAAACRRLGLDPVDVVRVRPGSLGGPEAAARDARYAALAGAADRHGAALVLLGHTLDDQAEQVLLGLARGAGARSLAGMPARRGHLVRPLLGLRRADTLAACAALGLDPWHDPTNTPAGTAPGGSPGVPPGVPPVGREAAAPLRSRVRAEVLPVLEAVLGPGVAAALARSAAQLREDADALDALGADLLARARDDVPPGGSAPGAVVLVVAPLAAAVPAVRRRALRAAAIAAGSPAGSLHRVHVLAVDALVTDWHGQGPLDLPGLTVRRAYGRLELQPDR